MDKSFIENTLKSNFPDADLAVHDMTGGGDHWEVQISSSLFKGLSRVQQHQLVMKSFQSELQSGALHALALITKVKD